MSTPAKNPCGTCPYRYDVPSGVWAVEEYEKLPEYDRETHLQPAGMFMCHQQDGHLCAGWVGCHDMDNNLAVRIASALGHLTPAELEAVLSYESPVLLWSSGTEAAEHGLRDIEAPGEKASRAIDKLSRKLGQ